MCMLKEQRELHEDLLLEQGYAMQQEWNKRREQFNCEMHAKACSYGICDECPLTNPEYREE